MGSTNRLLPACFAFSCLVAPLAQAREHYDLFVTPAMLSMGRATSAIVDDYSSVYSNPAGLAQIEDWELRLPELAQVQVSPQVLNIINEISTVAKANQTDVTQLTAAFRKFDGQNVSLGMKLLGLGYVRPRMALMINPLDLNASMRVRTPSVLFLKIQARATADSGISMGYAHPFLENHLRVGAVIRPFLVRGGFDKTFTNTDIFQLQSVTSSYASSLFGAGWGFDGSIGVQGNLDAIEIFDQNVKFMGGMDFDNVLATNFSHPLTSQATGAVPPLERKANIGVAATVEDLGVFKPTLSVEWREIGVSTDKWIEHLCAGAELQITPKSWFKTALRAHFYEGNIGGGIAGKLLYGELEFGTYAVNLGNGPGIGVDRRVFIAASAAF